MQQENNAIFQLIHSLKERNLPFVCFKKPNSKVIKVIEQNDSSLNYLSNFSQSGFVFAPFDATKKSVFFDNTICKTHLFSFINNLNSRKVSSVMNSSLQDNSAKTYKVLVEKAIAFIKNSKSNKIVLSRKEKMEIANFDAIKTFEKLLHLYPLAFVYIWYHPKVGLWLGATPETLVEIKNKRFKTMALAGTQTCTETIIWQEKEQVEQQIVTNFIIEKLKMLNLNFKTSKPYTKKAGSLVHLCTDVAGVLNTNSIGKLIKTLHPTPAVCGLPKKSAKQFILKNENYDREFYTGYLGEINTLSNKRQRKNNHKNIENQAYNFSTKQSELYVNLRCMKIEKKSISLYIGGGITKDSNPAKEYLETCAKANIMKAVLV